MMRKMSAPASNSLRIIAMSDDAGPSVARILMRRSRLIFWLLPAASGALCPEAFRAAAPEQFVWKQPPYEYEYTLLPFDILCGTSDTRAQIEAGVKAEAIARSWEPSVAAFEQVRTRFLLY